MLHAGAAAREVLDGRSDIFGFGVVLYEMLSGRQPLQSKRGGSHVGHSERRATDVVGFRA
jgi:serine/threonine protein kinase